MGPLEKMLPLTLGANIGSTMTAVIASLVSLKFGAVQIALCHLWFNLLGIMIWFPIPIMRRIPLGAAKLLGLYARHLRLTPLIYLFTAFVLVPGMCLGIGFVFNASVAGGWVLLLLVLVALIAFELLWLIGLPKTGPLCYKVLPKELRVQGAESIKTPTDDKAADSVSEARPQGRPEDAV